MSTPRQRNPPNTGGFFNAILRGRGAVAQSLQQAIAVATRGIYVGGQNSGIVNTGFLLTINNYCATSTARLSKRGLARNVHAYIEWMRQYCDEVVVFADPSASDVSSASGLKASRIDGERTFVPLKVIEVNATEPRTASCEHLLSLAPNRGVVLLADAGQGKSMIFLNLVRQLCSQLLVKRGWESAAELQKVLGFSSFKALAIPFYLPLNVFAEALRNGSGLKDYLDQHLRRESFQLPADFFSALIDHDQPVVLLLDGLDEILDADLRERVAEHLRNLSSGKHNVRFVISSRSSAYRGKAQLGSDLAHFAITPFDAERLDKIVRTMYLALCAGSGQDARKTRDLLAEIKRLEDQRKAAGEENRLIDSPLMATLAVQVREYTGQALPSRRADFLAKAVEALLNANYDREADERRLLRQAVGGWENHRHLLSILALARLQHGARDLTEPTLRQILGGAGIQALHMEALIQFANSRGGLLRKQADSRYWFVHLAIQQWLAAWRLIEQDVPANNLADFFVADERMVDEKWREVALLVAGLRRERPDNPLGDNDRLASFLEALAARAGGARLPPATRFACADAAVRAADENLDGGHPLSAKLTQVAADMLEDDAAMATGSLEARLFLGAWLTRHGDPRPHVMTVDATRLCFVPRGPFQMGDNASDYANERPLHEFDIPYDYWIGRYPITNAQFNAFVQETVDGLKGYANPKWWTVARQARAWADGQVIQRVYRAGRQSPELQAKVDALRRQERFAEADNMIIRAGAITLGEERASMPAPIRFHQREIDFGECVKRFPSHPVAGVTWYEALAFCAWLDERWHKRGWLTGDWHVTLPNEPEWEKAARGGLEVAAKPLIVMPQHLAETSSATPVANPNARRQYPWGDAFSAELCNVEETGIHFTSSVGCFASSAHPYGCQEMSGNVFEWTRSLYGPYDYDKRAAYCEFEYPYSNHMKKREDLTASIDITRVLRGGSFGNYEWGARCAVRYGLRPDNRGGNHGFRVVVSPISL